MVLLLAEILIQVLAPVTLSTSAAELLVLFKEDM